MNFNQYEYYKDSFNLYNLIRKIDDNYRLVFDKKNKCFCVINIAKNNQICLNFANFNQNIEKYLKFTRVENSQKIFDFIENNNKLLESKQQKQTTSKTIDIIKEIDKFAKASHSISKQEINKIIRG